jgi:N-methylhydantoinase B
MSNWGDLNGQLNALDLGEKRLGALLDEYGAKTIDASFEAFSNRAEALMRSAISSMPDGTYSFEDVLDNDGITDEMLTVALDLTISGDTMELDFSRSTQSAQGPINISRSTTIAACYVALKHIFTEVPANAGCLRPISFNIVDNSLLGANAPKPVAGYTETILRLIGVVLGAIAQADPDRATAAPFGTINALSVAGHRQNGSRWVMFSFFGGGLGGNPVSDGLNHANNPISTATIPPVEILEAAYPVMFTQWALRPDSAGAGTHRGGVGAIYELELLSGGDVALLGERGKQAPFGVLGGEPAALNRFFWQTEDGEASPPMASKITDLRLAAGKRIRLETPGGGGWGNPHGRDPDKVLHDVKLGLVSVAQAKALYGVVIGTDGEIDMQATNDLRNGVAA